MGAEMLIPSCTISTFEIFDNQASMTTYQHQNSISVILWARMYLPVN
jgi:hypothetical protein